MKMRDGDWHDEIVEDRPEQRPDKPPEPFDDRVDRDRAKILRELEREREGR